MSDFEAVTAEEWEASAEALEGFIRDDPEKYKHLAGKPRLFRDYARMARERLAAHTIFHHPV